MKQEYQAHPQAIVESPHIGPRTRIWAFAHILPGARVGADCNVCDGVFIENDVVVGDRVTIKCGVQLWDGVTLEDDVFVGPNATFTNDPFPRSRRHPVQFGRTIVRRGASIGANATLLSGIEIGEAAMVGAGAVVTKNVPPNILVVGNPARIVRATKEGGKPPSPADAESVAAQGARIVDLPVFPDDRGTLTFGQVGSQLPFVPLRYFAITSVPVGKVRGQHAHRVLHQFLVCLHGGCTIMIDDGRQQRTFRLESPGVGLHVPPMHWNRLYDFTADAVLLCLSSGEYDLSEYIPDYESFIRITTGA